MRTKVEEKINIPLERKPLPAKLMFVLCFFLFAINLAGGLTSHNIHPFLEQQFISYSKYYGIIPYVVTLLFFTLNRRQTTFMLPVFLGTSLLGLSYLSFGLMGSSLFNYFLTETFLQVGWALLDLIMWTLFGIVASVYGRPIIICGYAFLANLSAVFAGGLLGFYLRTTSEGYDIVAASFAIGIVFISVLIAHWLNQTIEEDLRIHMEGSGEIPSGIVDESHPLIGHLTPREKEITVLLLKGYTNKQIAEALNISENTMKTHNRKIYAKLNVVNKRELLQLAHGAGFYAYKSK